MRAYELVSDIMSREEFQKCLEKIKGDFFGLIDEETSEILLLDEVGRLDKEVNIGDMKVGKSYIITLIVDTVYPQKRFKKGEGEGKVVSILGFDGEDNIRVVFWDEKVDELEKMGLKKGDVVRVINGLVKENRGRKEIHLSRTSTLEKVEPGEVHFETTPIGALTPSDRENIRGRITSISAPKSFERGEREIKLRKIELEDETGTIGVALWNERADEFEELGLKVGEEVFVIGGFAKSYSNKTEISCDWRGRLLRA